MFISKLFTPLSTCLIPTDFYLSHPYLVKCIKEQMTKLCLQNFKKKSYINCIMLKIQRLEGKHCRSRWDGSLWAVSSESAVFANSAIVVFGYNRLLCSAGSISRRGFKVTKGGSICSIYASFPNLSKISPWKWNNMVLRVFKWTPSRSATALPATNFGRL